MSANTDINGDSECSIEEWDSTSHGTMPLDESESLSLGEDEDALHAHRWDLTPVYPAPPAIPQDTHSPHMHGRPLESRRPPPERWHRSACSAAPALHLAPHSRARLPLLFVSLLLIDDATLHPVDDSPAHSAPFPGPIHLSNERTSNTESTASLHYLNLRSSMGPSRWPLLLHAASSPCHPIRSGYPNLHSLAC